MAGLAPAPSLDGFYSFQSPAKINFSLKIGRRESNGLHRIFSFIRAIGIFDKISFRLAHKGYAIKVIPGETLKNSKIKYDLGSLENDGNLAIRAAKIFFEKIMDAPRGLNVTIEKNIPLKGGLGGGSSNAGSMLKFLNKLFNNPLNGKELLKIAVELGSDVPFFLTEEGAVVSGFGEKIYKIKEELPFYHIVVLIPNFGVATAEAYANFDDFLLTNNLNYYNIQFLDFKKMRFENDFEAVIFNKYPILKEMKDSFISEGADISLLSGSGSSIFGAFKNKESAEMYLDKLKSFPFNDRVILSILTTTL